MHLARLNGSAVAVKVRHPRVGAELEARLRAARAAAYAQPLHTSAREQADFRLLELLARAVDSVPGLRWLDAQSTVKQFGCWEGALSVINGGSLSVSKSFIGEIFKYVVEGMDEAP